MLQPNSIAINLEPTFRCNCVQYPPSALFYGDIRTEGFVEIWESAPFQGFRRGFESGDYPEECKTCYLLYGK